MTGIPARWKRPANFSGPQAVSGGMARLARPFRAALAVLFAGGLTRWNRSIGFRLTAMFVGVMLVLVAFSVTYYPYQQKHLGVETTSGKAHLLADMVAFSLGSGLSDGNLTLIETAMNAAKQDSAVSYMAAFDENNALLADYSPRKGDFAAKVQSHQDGTTQTGNEIWVLQPIVYKGQTYGRLALVYSLDELNSTISHHLMLSVLINLALAGVCVLLIMFFSRSLTRKIAVLRDVTRHVADGDLHQSVDQAGEDEIGQLYAAVAEMIRRLRESAEASRRTIDMATRVVAEVARTAEQLQAGALDTRAAVDDADGELRRMLDGFNQALDALVTPLADAATVLRAAAGRDLTRRMDGARQGRLEEFRNDINSMIASLDEALSHVALATGQVNTASEQISAGSQELANAASRQAASLEEVSSTLEEVASVSQRSSETARQAQGLVQAAREGAAQGMESMGRLSEAMEQIKSSSDKTARIVKTIDQIAFQTNLLALNAAVEAARAGDSGRGFAVVAEEVRNLARRSAEAARSTAELIDESVKSAEQGVTLNGEVLGNLGKINELVEKVTHEMEQIVTGSAEQNRGIHQVNAAMETINQATQEAAASSEESASAAQELSRRATEMNRLVAGFHLTKGIQEEAGSTGRLKLAGRRRAA